MEVILYNIMQGDLFQEKEPVPETLFLLRGSLLEGTTVEGHGYKHQLQNWTELCGVPALSLVSI